MEISGKTREVRVIEWALYFLLMRRISKEICDTYNSPDEILGFIIPKENIK